jgi:hypothetical protein
MTIKICMCNSHEDASWLNHNAIFFLLYLARLQKSINHPAQSLEK